MSMQESDAAAAAVQKTPNRIPLEYIESQINDEMKLDVPEDLKHLTVLLVRFRNGFVVIGKSAPADPENYDAELGYRFAREDCIRQAWPLFAFALRCDLAGQNVAVDIKAHKPIQKPAEPTEQADAPAGD